MSGNDWIFVGIRLPDGLILHDDLPLEDVTVKRSYNESLTMTFTISTPLEELTGPDGKPLMREHRSAVVAIHRTEGKMYWTMLVDEVSIQGQSWSPMAAGFMAALNGSGWDGPRLDYVEVDPLDIVRDIWAHFQAQPGGDLNVIVDNTVSDTTVGTEEEEVEFSTGGGEDVSFMAGPYRINSWSTDDLQDEIISLAKETPFQFREETTFDYSTGQFEHLLRLGYPDLAEIRDDMPLVIGENVMDVPQLNAKTWATHVMVWGAGEGETRVQSGLWPTAMDGYGVRRVYTHTDKELTTLTGAREVARQLADRLNGGHTLTQVNIYGTETLPLIELEPGNIHPLWGDAQTGGNLQMWVRILEIDHNLLEDYASLTVEEVGILV